MSLRKGGVNQFYDNKRNHVKSKLSIGKKNSNIWIIKFLFANFKPDDFS